MVSFWSLSSNPNLKKGALTDYKDLVRFEWEGSKTDEMLAERKRLDKLYGNKKLKFVDG